MFELWWDLDIIFRKKHPNTYNFKVSEHKFVLSKAAKSTLDECEVSSKSCAWVCVSMLWLYSYSYSCIWHADYNVMLLMDCISSDVWTQAFLYLRFLIVIKLPNRHNKSVKFPCVSTFVYPMTWLVVLAWYNTVACNKIWNVALVSIKYINKKYCLKYTLT